MWTLLVHICGWANRKIPWMYSILHSRHEERLLDGHTSPRFKASNLHVNRHWKIPMDTASNGKHCCLWCLPIETRWNIPQHTRSHWNCRWYGHLWEINWEMWQAFLELPIIWERKTWNWSASKLLFQLQEVSFFRHNCSSNSISLDPKKIQAIQQMEFPPDKDSIHSSLKVVNFLNRYSPRLVGLSTSLRQLCRLPADYNLNQTLSIFKCHKEGTFHKIMLPYYAPASCTTLETE